VSVSDAASSPEQATNPRPQSRTRNLRDMGPRYVAPGFLVNAGKRALLRPASTGAEPPPAKGVYPSPAGSCEARARERAGFPKRSVVKTRVGRRGPAHQPQASPPPLLQQTGQHDHKNTYRGGQSAAPSQRPIVAAQAGQPKRRRLTRPRSSNSIPSARRSRRWRSALAPARLISPRALTTRCQGTGLPGGRACRA